MRTIVLVTLAACGGEPADCVTGFDMGDDGLCYEVSDTDVALDTDAPAPVTVYEGWLAALPDCDVAAGDGRLDLVGCADGVCVGDYLAAYEAAFGEGRCDGTFGYVFCDWENGVGTMFDDPDGDGVPAERARSQSLTVAPPYDGTTSEGIGLGASIRCFVDVLGTPSSITIDPSGEGLGNDATWYEPAYISLSDGTFGAADSRADWLYLGGGGG